MRTDSARPGWPQAGPRRALRVLPLLLLPAVFSWAGAAEPPGSPETWEDIRDGAAGVRGWPSEQDGRASAVVEPSSLWVAGSSIECRVIFRVADVPIEAGGGVRVAFRRGSDMGPFQTSNPSGAGFVSAQAFRAGDLDAEALKSLAACGYVGHTGDGRELGVVRTEVGVLDRQGCSPWPRAVEVLLPDGLPPGGVAVVVLGDVSRGGPGFHVQSFSEETPAIRTYSDGDGDGVFRPLTDCTKVQVLGGEADHFRVVAPAVVVAGEKISIAVRAEDPTWNTATGYAGEADVVVSKLAGTEFWEEPPRAGLTPVLARGAAVVRRWHVDRSLWAEGRAVIDDAVVGSPGLYAVRLEGDLKSPSLPILAVSKSPGLRLYWGDMHGHSELSDGAGTIEGYYEFARRGAGMDVAVATDHDWLMSDPEWRRAVEAADRAYDPGRFVTFPAYEWSEYSATGGDHDVYYVSGEPEIFRCSRAVKVDTRAFSQLLEYLEDRDVFVIPHVGGRRANWDRMKPEAIDVCEIASVHGWNEAFGLEGLEKGFRVGFLASSDNHTGHPGRAHPAPPTFAVKGGGLAGIWAGELTRQGIAEAIRARRTLATTGERILVDFRVGGAIMGSETRAGGKPVEVVARVAGTAPIDSVEIQRGFETVYRAEPGAPAFVLRWTDPHPESGEVFYYLRVTQADGNKAWSSPVWVQAP